MVMTRRAELRLVVIHDAEHREDGIESIPEALLALAPIHRWTVLRGRRWHDPPPARWSSVCSVLLEGLGMP